MSDLIDRQTAIDALDRLCDDSCVYSKKQRNIMCGACSLGGAFDVIEALPSAQPERKGKWIYGENDGQDGWYCSECGFFIPWDYDYYGLGNIDFISDFVACPHCEAKMVSYTGKGEDHEIN